MSRETLSALYENRKESWVRYAFSRLGNWEEAEDTVQDAMVILLGREMSFPDAGNMEAWIYGVLKNIILARRRKRRKEAVVMGDLGTLSPKCHSLTPRLDILYEEAGTKVDLQLLILFYCYQYDVKYLCRRYGIKASACRMRIMRTKGYLRKQLLK